MDFLDTSVKLVDGSLQTELFIKPTSSLSYLHRDSCHPTHVFQSLPYGEFLRVCRNCSTLSSFNHFSNIILEAFIQRGCDRVSLLRAQEHVGSIDRSSLLDSHANPQDSHRTNRHKPEQSFWSIFLHPLHHKNLHSPVSHMELNHLGHARYHRWPLSIQTNLC